MTAQAVRIADRQKGIERRNVAIIAALAVACVFVAFAALSSGASNMGLLDSVQALFGFGSSQDVMTVRSIRLPRVVCAIVAGAGLALAGAALQSVLENPLASASTVGISQGAAFGATVAILLIIPSFAGSSTNVGMGTIALFAFAGAMASSLIVLLFSRLGFSSPESIILVGVALSALWAGASTIIQYFSGRPRAHEGHLLAVRRPGSCHVVADRAHGPAGNRIAPRTSSPTVRTATRCRTAATWRAVSGVDVKRTRVLGVDIALAHGCRHGVVRGAHQLHRPYRAAHRAPLGVGDDYRFLLPASLVLGAIIMLASDLAARIVISPIILPIGAITSFLGAPLFLYLLYRGYKR